MKKTVKQAFLATIPVLSGYLVLGFGFGIVMKSAGYDLLLAFVMSLAIYAGSMQYVAVGLFAGGASLLTVALTTLMVNARHLFYGISMLDKYGKMGGARPYLIFSLTDETYSLLCGDLSHIRPQYQRAYCVWVSLLDHAYWVLGTVLGFLAGALLRLNTEGIEFALTALFLTVFIEQWLQGGRRVPASVGVLATLGCLLVLGAESFLIPSMLVIALVLCLQREGVRRA